ncbi:uncharacterized protein LOC109819630 isoform X2 [Asparagus officinalis]|uniref:uncharacterized protein LOC109819630 isoform X2 n=1 Tax=Asparagus officinalis TaxID=4686 RepID=UPI00098E5ABE|nr:uncharacterized protein LOC109819630 isoform X2 [Asparagus officinalis]
MEQKSFLMSALGVGLSVGVGLGVGRWTAQSSAEPGGLTAEKLEAELMKQVIDGKEGDASFDRFPYYLSDQTHAVLTSAAFVHLKQAEISKYTRKLSPASRAILLSGPAELYQQMLAKALAHHFEAKLLLLDITDFSLKMQSKYGDGNKDSLLKRSISEAAIERMSGLFESFSLLSPREEPKAPLKRTSSWSFDEKVLLQSVYKVLTSISKINPTILYIRDVENFLSRSQRMYSLFQKMLTKISGPVLILGSRLLDSDSEFKEVDESLTLLFPYNIEIKPPEDEMHLGCWKSQLEEDMKKIQIQDNRNHIAEVLVANDLECDDLSSICLADTMTLSNYIEEIVISAVSYHLMNNKDPEYRNGKLVISSKSLSHGLSLFQQSDSLKLEANAESSKEVGNEEATKSDAAASENKSETDKSSKPAKAPEVAPDNEFEKRIRSEVIPANEIGVTFDDIGALGDIKESLQELVMLPLQRPDLFKGGLLKPCRGILLFGPPGTGKTMLAKAIANEAGASFINVSMATITSKWFGEDEKNVRALFSLAAKVSPTIIFVDEVDSMLGHRSRIGEHEAMRKIKNEFMSHWDGILTKSGARILVLAATNRPFDLDEAIIRRFERRIMVGLPMLESRELILRTLLSKEKVEEGIDYKELATMTEGYSGSDLKNLCTTAAYRPVRELLQKEKLKELEKKENAEKGEGAAETTETKEDVEPEIILRPLNMEDMRQAKNQVSASFATEGSVMSELRQWNDLYGEGGSRKKEQLSYFL